MSQATTRDFAPRLLWVVDDDELIRELLSLIAAEVGLKPKTFASGDDVMAHLGSTTVLPAAILCDMQMPGIAGRELAKRLRAICGPQTILLGMSGSMLGAGNESQRDFDAFLLKPFSARQLAAACELRAETRTDPADPIVESRVILDPTIHAKLSRSMPPARLAELYQLCVTDARKRVELMEQATAIADDTAYRAAAHAIKGACSMVGAVSVAAIASDLEQVGLPPSPDQMPLKRLLTALTQLERMLNDEATAS